LKWGLAFSTRRSLSARFYSGHTAFKGDSNASPWRSLLNSLPVFVLRLETRKILMSCAISGHTDRSN
jgi:hypothetical protein